MNPLRYLLVITLFSSMTATGQYTSRRGFFQVDQISGCNPLQVQVTVVPDLPDGVSCRVFAVDWIGGTAPTDISTGMSCQLSHTYNTTGTFLLRVFLGGGVGSNNIDDIQITVTDNIAPDFEISACNNSNVMVTVTDRNYDEYFIDFDNDGTIDATKNKAASIKASFTYPSTGFKTIAVRGKDNNSAFNCTSTLKFFNATTNLTAAIINSLEITAADSVELTYSPAQFVEYRIDIGIGGTNYQQFGTRTTPNSGQKSEQVGGLLTDNNFYCFQFRTVDPCLNTNVVTGSICSVNLNLSIDYDVNHLNWITNNAFISNFTVERNADPAYGSVSGVLNEFNDSNITCATDYCYKITANYSSGAKSISAQRCGTSITSNQPLPIDNIVSVAEENSVELSWYQDGNFNAKTYFINREENLTGFSTIASTPDSVYTDGNYNVLSTFTYRIDYQDVCNLFSPPGIVFNPILLNGTVNEDNTIKLIWSNYGGYRFGVFRYVLEKFDADGALIRQRNFYPPDSTWLDEFDDLASQGVSYRLTAYPLENNIPVSKSNPIYLERQARLIFPTAFSPNGDNLNDGFTVYGQFVRSMKLQIFDRWGELLFSTEASEPWDGTHRGQKMPESVYVWKASITDLLGRSLTRTGSVALLYTKN